MLHFEFKIQYWISEGMSRYKNWRMPNLLMALFIALVLVVRRRKTSSGSTPKAPP
jgi:hypothetical protein